MVGNELIPSSPTLLPTASGEGRLYNGPSPNLVGRREIYNIAPFSQFTGRRAGDEGKKPPNYSAALAAFDRVVLALDAAAPVVIFLTLAAKRLL